MVERMLAEQRLLAYKEASRLYISDGARQAPPRSGPRPGDSVRSGPTSAT